MKSKKRMMTPERFNELKTLSQAAPYLSTNQLAKVVGVSGSTMWAVKKHGTFTDYRAYVQAKYVKRQETKETMNLLDEVKTVGQPIEAVSTQVLANSLELLGGMIDRLGNTIELNREAIAELTRAIRATNVQHEEPNKRWNIRWGG